MDVDIFSALETSIQGITVENVTTSHFDAGLCLFAAGTVGMEKVEEHHYASSAYANLRKDRHRKRAY